MSRQNPDSAHRRDSLPCSLQSCCATSVACVSGNASFAAQKHISSLIVSKWPRAPHSASREPTSHASSAFSNTGVGSTGNAASATHWQSWFTGFSQRAVNLPHFFVREPASHTISLSVSTAALSNSSLLAHLHSPTTRHESKSHSP